MITLLKFGVPAVLIAAGAGFGIGYFKGQSDYREDLLERRVVTLQQLRRVDNEIFSADRNGLCALLGGCSVPD